MATARAGPLRRQDRSQKDAPRDPQKAISLGPNTEDIAAIPAESAEPGSGDPDFQKVAALQNLEFDNARDFTSPCQREKISA